MDDVPAADQLRQIVAHNLKLARRANNGISAGRVARQVGVAPSYYSDWERAIHKPGEYYLTVLAGVLHVADGWLWFLSPHTEPPALLPDDDEAAA